MDEEYIDEENLPAERWIAYADSSSVLCKAMPKMLEGVCHVDVYDINATEEYTPKNGSEPIKPGRDFVKDVEFGSYDAVMVSKEGLRYLGEIMESDPGISVLLMSKEADAGLAKKHKCSAFIEEPCPLGKLREAIGKALAGLD